MGGTIHGMALCAGIGGLELGGGLALGSAYHTVCWVERKLPVAALLVAAMENGALDALAQWALVG